MKLYRKISLFAIVSSSIVIIYNLFLLSVDNHSEVPKALGILSGTLTAFDLNIFSHDFNITSYLWINFSFELLFLCGGLLYLNKGKEMRILRFAFSVILLSKILLFLASFFYLPIDAANPNLVEDLLFFGYYSIVKLAWIYFSFRALKYMNGTRELETTATVYSTAESTSYVESSKSTRLLHLVIDTVMMILIFSSPITTLLHDRFFVELFMSIVKTFGPNGFATLLLAFVASVYYLFFEIIVQASPAKFLTETRVLTVDGKPIDLPIAIARTLSRWIPFDAFSFLFSSNGWHDRFSRTAVLKEKENSEEITLF